MTQINTSTPTAEDVIEQLSELQIQAAVPEQPMIQQSSVFSVLPSELILEIFSYLDILTIFEFLDTCRYHRYLLLNLPEIWRKVRFFPLSELITLQNQIQNSSTAVSSNTTTTIAAAAAFSKPRSSTSTEATSPPAKAEATKPSHRLKHAENERDQERGGSRSLISEIYAVLRRFRKDNRLVGYVREV
jgi:hypothetical protein